MDDNGYRDMDSLCGDALKLFQMDKDLTALRKNRLADAYQEAQEADSCIGCGRCVDVCWHEGIEMRGKAAAKTDKCIGCGYCFQVCPTGALHVGKERILASAFEERGKDFFARFFPEYRGRSYICHSCLLGPELTSLLPPESNIVRFQGRFLLCPF